MFTTQSAWSRSVFSKGQNVEMTVEGLAAIRMKPDGTIKQHRNGQPFSSTGVVMSTQRSGQGNVLVKLDSAPNNNGGEYFAAKFWKPVEQNTAKCYACDDPCERPNVHRTLSRGPREGQTIGPLCDDCERSLDAQVLLKPLETSQN
jgi:hypothetical protein